MINRLIISAAISFSLLDNAYAKGGEEGFCEKDGISYEITLLKKMQKTIKCEKEIEEFQKHFAFVLGYEKDLSWGFQELPKEFNISLESKNSFSWNIFICFSHQGAEGKKFLDNSLFFFLEDLIRSRLNLSFINQKINFIKQYPTDYFLSCNPDYNGTADFILENDMSIYTKNKIDDLTKEKAEIEEYLKCSSHMANEKFSLSSYEFEIYLEEYLDIRNYFLIKNFYEHNPKAICTTLGKGKRLLLLSLFPIPNNLIDAKQLPFISEKGTLIKKEDILRSLVSFRQEKPTHNKDYFYDMVIMTSLFSLK